MKNKISVIVPVYNVEKYLEKCIDSLIKQDYKNYEIILIDDGSTDNSLKICRNYEEKNNKIKVLSQKNSGVSVARNYGMSVATGEWICFMDSDDYAEPNMLSLYVKEVIDKKYDILITAPVIEYDDISYNAPIFLEDRIFDKNNCDELILNIICRQFISKDNTKIGAGAPWGKLYRKKFLIENNLQFIIGLNRMQDVVFNVYAVNCATKIAYKNLFLYHYRINSGSSTIKYNPNIFETFSEVINIFYNFAIENNKSNDFFQSIYLKTILLFIEGSRIGIININNKNSYFQKRKQLISIYKMITFNKGFKKIKFKYLNNQLKIFVLCFKLRFYDIAYLIIKIFIVLRNREQN